MPTYPSTGWTSQSLAPSWALLGGSTGNAGAGIQGTVLPSFQPNLPQISYQGGIPQIPGAPPAVQDAVTNLYPDIQAATHGVPGGLPSIPAVLPPGWGGSGRGRGGGGGPQGVGEYLPPTPEQAYSMYLLNRIKTEGKTPLETAQKAYNDASLARYYSDPGQNITALTQTPWQQAKKADQFAAQTALLRASPYAYAYGTPAAQAPAPTPAWGYPGSWGAPAPGLQNILNAQASNPFRTGIGQAMGIGGMF